jgi:PhzF family phenazine biosynthesis protein
MVDAFADAPYTGNPAAVMVVDEFPEDMQQIAAQMNLSETVFVKKQGLNHYHIRWFTPMLEAKICGHATMAASHILFQEKLIQGSKITFDSLSGPLIVSKESNAIVLDFPLQRVDASLSKQNVERIFNTSIQEVVKAHDDVIVLLDNEEVVKHFVPDFEKIKTIDARGVIITAPSNQYDFVSRFFAPNMGINEDPVTGSAHTKLADYWAKRLNKQSFVAYQASARGGILHIQIENGRVLLKGKAITVMAGNWLV